MSTRKIILPALVFLLAVIATPLFAQKCFLSIDEKDPFTGEHKRMYKHAFYSTKPTTIWELQFNQTGTAYTMTVSPFVSGRNLIDAPAGSVLLLKLEDNTIMEFKVGKSVPPIFTLQYGDKTKWELKFDLTLDQMKKFAGSPLSTLKATMGTIEVYCPEIGGSGPKKIMRAAGCMLLD